MFLKFTQKIAAVLLVFVVCSGQSFGQFANGPIDFHRQFEGPMPIAIYSGIKAQDFKKLIITAFEKSNFTFVSSSEDSKLGTLYRFSYSIEFDGKSQAIQMFARSDGDIDSRKRCANCFLRQVQIADKTIAKSMSWMLQYEFSSRIFPDIDRAFENIKIDGQKYMDPKHGFDYKNQWRGERNFFSHGNSYVGVEFAALKREVIQAYKNAGFDFSDEKVGREHYTTLVFNFPITEAKKEGVVYAVGFMSQLNSDALCAPCEMTENYSPYQRLPAMGVMGMADRLTLESRFLAARTRALELVKSATTRYLRPRTDFVMPPKPLPLGSPLPPPPPPT